MTPAANTWLRHLLALAAAVVLGGCGSGSSSVLPAATPQPAVARSPIPAPPGLVNPVHLTVGADYHFAPQSYVDANGHAAGFDIDLAGAIASHLKLKLTVLNIDDPSIIQGLSPQDRRYDVGVNQPAPVASAAGLPLLPYFAGGQALLVPSADARVKGTGSLCGLKVGAAPGSEGELELVKINDGVCQDKKVQVMAAADDVAAAKDVGTGKLDGLIDDYPATVLLGKTSPGTRVVPHHAPVTSIDYVFPPGGDSIRDAVSAALTRLQKDGTYQRLLNQWGLGEGAILKP
ncbi:MAG TPA: transporter substrate-binding domain-containing protein [Candidatus Dormibacteraeota bacterium]|nr:transporter substrate-binding domain-containing protein [Candidatus Dormibacteraeota bacterium]